MREIKFRGYDKNAKRMFHEIDVIKFTANNSINIVREGGYGEGVCILYQPHIELMQYTGLKDKNGVEIYEGDIVNIDTYSYEEPEFSGGFKVVYDEVKGMWLFVDLEDENNNYTFENMNSYYITEIEIIGNIYDNPELLKESEY